ncbi:protein disulfide-isomerase precursor [Clydaea vesicula]|uniref:Protein disulfide-isomerase n=1 Tax=Clydaea vesicula TaxID=447962 RepID=A0AAD5U2N5_9FUNG|nr:protein disulfide-isomerase precursor [Clydaea vesicula]KAJ3387908.1 protein disulfide-isomerase precursor [Lobulomyces angularis]
MKNFLILSTLVLSAFSSSEVHVLTNDNYGEFVKNEKLTLIEFYAPWCGHCKALAPEYEDAAEKLKEKNVKLAKVDCTVETEVCSSLQIQGYPTLKIFRDGTPSDYKGLRTSSSIVSTMVRQSQPALIELKAEAVEKFSQEDKVVVVGYFKSTDSEEFKTFQSTANKYRDDYQFGYTTEGVSTPKVTLFKQFDDKKVDFSGKLTSSTELVTFIKDQSVPQMDEIGPENYSAYVSRGLPIVYLFYGSADDREKYGGILKPFAKTFKGKLQFAYIDAVKYGGHGKTLNLVDTWPAIAIQDTTKNAKYPFDQSKPITKEALSTFLNDFVSGKIEPSLKSEPVPESNDGPVKVVVGTEFESIVLDKSADVLLELYAPWCGHCKKLAPIWEELGEHLKGSKVVIAKMDGTENDLPAGTSFQVEGFPTIKLFKANDNTIVDYEGDRTLDSFVSFLKKNAVHADSFEDVKAGSQDTDSHDNEDHDEL